MLNRGVFIAAVSVLATGSWFAPDPAVGGSNSNQKVTNHKISETYKFVSLGFEGKPGTDMFRQIAAGTVDGRIGARSVHGAFRDVGQFTSSHSSIDRGTEYDARGSRSFVMHNTFSISSNRQVTNNSTGRWTGGTGAYRHARGRFKLSGGGPLGGVQTSHLTGSIIY
jgi:hypothetical protein